ncbi:Hypothetical_protein [Hexamita inflata]|uniref:Hypothetical_protein n=1 Tax=Hexamita inflata TaxID=28002 RepID=A0AA86RFE4_9EUKA|nr:Hypothetical protein HINF_LOCUS63102 [Hexamita inflata]
MYVVYKRQIIIIIIIDDLIKHRFQVLNKELDSDSKCLLCGNRMTAQHEIKCNRNAGIRTVRHDYVMKKVLAKIDHHRHPRPVDKAHGNLPSSDKLKNLIQNSSIKTQPMSLMSRSLSKQIYATRSRARFSNTEARMAIIG